MTQRIFDVKNEKDMADLWNILPDNVCNIEKWRDNHLKGIDEGELFYCDLIEINWHYQNRITRPIQEATEVDVGKLCYFWDDDGKYKSYGILTLKDIAGGKPYYIADGNSTYDHCRRLTKQEVEELI